MKEMKQFMKQGERSPKLTEQVGEDGESKRKKRKPLPFQHTKYGLTEADLKEIAPEVTPRQYKTLNTKEHSPPQHRQPLKIADGSLKTLDLYKIKPIPEPNSFARKQGFTSTRAKLMVERTVAVTQDMLPSVDPLGHSYKG